MEGTKGKERVHLVLPCTNNYQRMHSYERAWKSKIVGREGLEIREWKEQEG
jgi:hypothetical protein